MVGVGEAEYEGEAVKIVTLVAPSIPQRRSLGSSTGTGGWWERLPVWAER